MKKVEQVNNLFHTFPEEQLRDLCDWKPGVAVSSTNVVAVGRTLTILID
jgi:hypothetical protein